MFSLTSVLIVRHARSAQSAKVGLCPKGPPTGGVPPRKLTCKPFLWIAKAIIWFGKWKKKTRSLCSCLLLLISLYSGGMICIALLNKSLCTSRSAGWKLPVVPCVPWWDCIQCKVEHAYLAALIRVMIYAAIWFRQRFFIIQVDSIRFLPRTCVSQSIPSRLKALAFCPATIIPAFIFYVLKRMACLELQTLYSLGLLESVIIVCIQFGTDVADHPRHA